MKKAFALRSCFALALALVVLPCLSQNTKEPQKATDIISTAEHQDVWGEVEIDWTEYTAEQNGELIYKIVEDMPRFPDGDIALLKYVRDHLRWPESKPDAQGRVVVKFVVRKDGSIGDAEILRGVCPELDAEAMRLIKSLPAFIPGTKGGEPVNVWYTLPVRFTLPTDIVAPKDSIEQIGASDSVEIYTSVENMPEFPGGEVELLKYIAQNLILPKSVGNEPIGKIVCRFEVKPDGSVGKIELLRGKCNGEVKAEIIRVINSLPSFVPGKMDGRPVSVWHTLPIYIDPQ